jgi:hypothetical protein
VRESIYDKREIYFSQIPLIIQIRIDFTIDIDIALLSNKC